MVPVKNPAGGAASVFHNQAKGTPDQYTDQIADIKQYRDHKQCKLADDTAGEQYSDHRNQQVPDHKHFIGRQRCADNIVFESLIIDFSAKRFESVGKKFLGTQRHLVFDGNDLKKDIGDPDQP